MRVVTVTSIPGFTVRRYPAKKPMIAYGRFPESRNRTWIGPHGSEITIINGSMAKPPRVLLLLIDRVLHRNYPWHNGSIEVLIRKCGRGCAHGYGSKHHLSLYLSDYAPSNRFLVEHEMAHVTNRLNRLVFTGRGTSKHSDRHGPGFYDALYRIGKDEGNLRALTQWQNNKAAMRRARQRAEGRSA